MTTDFWSLAHEALSDSEKQQLDKLSGKTNEDSFDELLQLVQQKRQLCLNSRLKIKKPDGTLLVLRDVFDKTFTWLDKFRGVGDVLAKTGSAYTALPWAAFRVLLEFLMSDSRNGSHIAEGLELVLRHVARNSLIEASTNGVGIFPDGDTSDLKKELHSCLSSFYTAVLVYLAKAAGFYESISLTGVLRDGFRSTDALQKELDLVQQRAREVQAGFNALTSRAVQETPDTLSHLEAVIESFDDPIIRTAAAIEETRDNLQEDERSQILQWLSTVLYADIHMCQVRDIVPGTAEWIQQKPEFLAWQASSMSSIFWLRGKPGYGKTKVTSKVIESSLKRVPQTPKHALFAYFYCSTGDPEHLQSRSLEVLRSILRQISVSHDNGNLKGSILSVYRNRVEDAQKSGADPAMLSMDECVDLILTLTADCPLTIVIDGIDELEGEQHGLLQSIGKIVDESVSIIKVFISGRPTQDIILERNYTISYDMTVADSDSDITQFVEHRVSRAVQHDRLLQGKVSDDARTKIVRMLSQGASGVFLWASLQLEQICDSQRFLFEEDVLSVLSVPPATLYTVLDSIVSKFKLYEPDIKDMVTRCIAWLLAARRPLTGSELLDAVSSGERRKSIDVGLLVQLCGGLIVFDASSSMCSFLHLSVREYFASLPEYNGSVVDALALKRCLTFYTAEEEIYNVPGDQPEEGSSIGGLGNYASMYWMEHFSKIRDPSLQLDAQAMLEKFAFGSDGLFFELWLADVASIFDRKEIWSPKLQQLHAVLVDNGSAIHTASAFDLPTLLQHVYQYSPPEICRAWTDSLNLDGASPVYISSRFGHSDTLRLFLQNGADPNIRGGHLDNPLQAAAFFGHISCLETLLDHQADFQASGKFANALEAGLAGGHEQIVVELIKRKVHNGAAIEAITDRALQLDFDNVLRMLNTENEDRQSEGSTMENLQKALFYGSVRAARAFLLQVEDINVSGGRYGNALQAAVLGGNERCVTLVLEEGADLTSLGTYGTALKAAAVKGHDKALACLLESGARDTGENTSNDATAAAAEAGHLSTVVLLLENMEPHTDPARIYPESLKKACSQGHEKVVDVLLAKFQPLNYGRSEQAALQSALFTGQLSVVRVFTKHFRRMRGLTEVSVVLATEGDPPSVLPDQAAAEISQLEEPSDSGEHLKSFIDQVYASRFGCTSHSHGDGGQSMRLAARLGDVEIIRILVDAGHSPSGTEDIDCYMRSAKPVEVAAAYGRVEAVELLLKLGSSAERALVFATRFGQIPVIQSLLNRYPDLEVDLEWGYFVEEFEVGRWGSHRRLAYGRTGPPLHFFLNHSALALAIYLGRKGLTEMFAKHKARSGDKMPNLSLVVAAQINDVAVLERLLKDKCLWTEPPTRESIKEGDFANGLDVPSANRWVEDLKARFLSLHEESLHEETEKSISGTGAHAFEWKRRTLVISCAVEYSSKARSYEALAAIYQNAQVSEIRGQLAICTARFANHDDHGAAFEKFLDTILMPLTSRALLFEISILSQVESIFKVDYYNSAGEQYKVLEKLVHKLPDLYGTDFQARDDALVRISQTALYANRFSLTTNALQMSDPQRQPLAIRAPGFIHSLMDTVGDACMSHKPYVPGLIQMFLQYGAQAARKNEYGYDVIARACLAGCAPVFYLLLGHDAEESLKSRKYWTPSNARASNGYSIRIFEKPTEVDLLSLAMFGLSKCQTERSWGTSLVPGYGDIVLFLASGGLQCDLENRFTVHFFQVACFQGHEPLLDLLEPLLGRYSPVGQKVDSMGLLHAAVLGARANICARLLHLGASPTYKANLRVSSKATSEVAQEQLTPCTPLYLVTDQDTYDDLRPAKFGLGDIRHYSHAILALVERGVSKEDEQRVFGFAMLHNKDSEPFPMGSTSGDLIQELMGHELDYTAADQNYPYLAALVRKGDLGWIQRLISEGFKIGEGHDDMAELITVATKANQLHVLDFLQENYKSQLPVDALDFLADSALQSGEMLKFKVLRRAEYDINRMTDRNEIHASFAPKSSLTLLSWSILGRTTKIETLQRLLQHGADPNTSNTLMVLFSGLIPFFHRLDLVPVAKTLLAGGSDPKIPLSFELDNQTIYEYPLHVAIGSFFPMEILKLLVAHGADVNADSGFGTPLFLAVYLKNHDAARFLSQETDAEERAGRLSSADGGQVLAKITRRYFRFDK